MQILDGTLYLHVPDLVTQGVDENTVKRGLHRAQKNLADKDTYCNVPWFSIPDPADRRRRLILFDSIPTSTRSKLPAKEELLARLLNESQDGQKEAENAAKWRHLARIKTSVEGFARFLPHYRDMMKGDPEAAAQWAKLAALYEGCLTFHPFKKSGLGGDCFAAYQEMLAIARQAAADTKTDRFRVSNARVFVRNLQNVRDNGVFAAVKPKNIGNRNGDKATALHRYLVKRYYALNPPLTAVQVCTLLNETVRNVNETGFFRRDGGFDHEVENDLPKLPLAELSERTVQDLCKKVENEVYPYRYGVKKWRDGQCPYTPRLAPQYPGDLWVLDGTQLQLWFLNEKGQPDFANVFFVMDATTRAIVGWSLDRSEDRFAVMRAVRMAVEFTNYTPFEVLTDNSSAIKCAESVELLTRLSRRLRHSRVGNAQDKVVERLIGTFQTTVCSRYPNYAGEGIKSRRKGAHATPEHVKKLFKQRALPTMDGLRGQMVEMVSFYNGTVQKGRTLSPLAMLRTYEAPHTQPVSREAMALLFWPGRKTTVRRGMISLTIRHVEHVYRLESPDLMVRLNSREVFVRYEEADLSEIHLFEAENTEEYLGSVARIERARMAGAEQTGRDLHLMQQGKQAADALEEWLETNARTEAEQFGHVNGLMASVTPTTVWKDDMNASAKALMMRLALDQADVSPEMVEMGTAPAFDRRGTTPFEEPAPVSAAAPAARKAKAKPAPAPKPEPETPPATPRKYRDVMARYDD